jgi:hypothetical protein
VVQGFSLDEKYEVEDISKTGYKLKMIPPLSKEQYEWNSTWFSKVNFETIG